MNAFQPAFVHPEVYCDPNCWHHFLHLVCSQSKGRRPYCFSSVHSAWLGAGLVYGHLSYVVHQQHGHPCHVCAFLIFPVRKEEDRMMTYSPAAMHRTLLLVRSHHPRLSGRSFSPSPSPSLWSALSASSSAPRQKQSMAKLSGHLLTYWTAFWTARRLAPQDLESGLSLSGL